jgi:hypothetical protein
MHEPGAGGSSKNTLRHCESSAGPRDEMTLQTPGGRRHPFVVSAADTGSNASSSTTAIWTSITSFEGRPGTDVDPMCSIPRP